MADRSFSLLRLPPGGAYDVVVRTVVVVACLLLEACGGGGGGDADGVAAPAVASPAPVVPLPGAVPGRTLVWSDEFDVAGLPDPAKWDYDTDRNRLGWYNNELQYYSRARLENSRVEGGKLIITARKESLTAAADFGGQQYTSARMLTRGKASWTYGFFEVRAKLPCGAGTWPAIWALGTGGRWPEDGEIDIMEQRGNNKTVILGTIHTRANNYFNGSLGVGLGSQTTVSDACTNFHNYQLTWTADKIVIGVDNVNYFSYPNPGTGDATRWPFDHPQYLILNLAIGGDLGGTVDNSAFPVQLEIDYVRVYRN